MKPLLFIFSLLFSFSAHAQTITTIAGNGTEGFYGEGGQATNAEISYAAGVTTDKKGNIYIADYTNNIVQKIDTDGVLTRFAGSGAVGDGGDGGVATTAQLNLNVVVGLTVDSVGDVYISCGQRVRKVNTSGIISAVAGNGIYGSSGDGGSATAAELKAVVGLCFDKLGNLYIADEQSSNVRMVNTSGIISTIAGTTIGFSGDGGPATNAQLKWPHGITLDDSGNIYIADFFNDRIRKINTSGIINTVAGASPVGTKFCVGCSAANLALAGLTSVAVDHIGNIYTSGAGDDAVQKITKDGKAYTIAGTSIEGYFGDRGPASSAQLHNPTMICLDQTGNLLITDKGNNRYRKVWLGTTYVSPLPNAKPGLHIYPNPVTHHQFTCFVSTNTNEEAKIVIDNILGQVVFSGACITNKPTDFSINIPPGIYFVTTNTSTDKMTEKLLLE